MQQWFSTWAALEPNCFAKANVRTPAALQYDGSWELRKSGFALALDRFIYLGGEGVRRRE
jgi:hypothetical protein